MSSKIKKLVIKKYQILWGCNLCYKEERKFQKVSF